MRETIDNLPNMRPEEINQIAYDKLVELLECCTINLIAKITRIQRKTLYRWLDADRSLEEMDYKQAAWFVLACEVSPKIRMLLQRGPMSHPRLAHRVISEFDDKYEERVDESKKEFFKLHEGEGNVS